MARRGGGEDRGADPDAVPPGLDAARPSEIPPTGWKDILVRAFKKSGKDNLSIVAKGVGFSIFTSLVPTLTAVIAIYGLVVSPDEAKRQIERVASNLPGGAQSTIQTLVENLTKTGSGALTAGLVVSIVIALYSASGAVNSLITAVALAYDEENNRSFIRKKAVAYGLTAGAIVFFIIVLALVAVLPALLGSFADRLPGGVSVLSRIVSLLLLLALFILAVGVLYRVGPDRAGAQVKWVTPGALTAAVAWVIASAGFGVYVQYGSFGSAFGTFSVFIVLLFWLYLTAYIIGLGAEINAAAEMQTARDTTTGDPRPIGQRGSVVADALPAGVTGPRANRIVAEISRSTGRDDERAPERGAATPPGGSADGGSAAAGAPAGDGPAGQADTGSGRVSDAGHHGRRGARMSDSQPAGGTPATAASTASTGELVKMLSEQVSTLVRSEVQLAQTEVKEKGKKLGVGAGLFGGAGFIVLYALNAAFATAIIVLHLFLPLWLSALIVTAALFLVGAILALLGRREVKQGSMPVPRQAIESTKKDVAAVREAAHR